MIVSYFRINKMQMKVQNWTQSQTLKENIFEFQHSILKFKPQLFYAPQKKTSLKNELSSHFTLKIILFSFQIQILEHFQLETKHIFKKRKK